MGELEPIGLERIGGSGKSGDACNGILVVPGTTPCANQVKFLAGLGVNLPLSNGTAGPNRPGRRKTTTASHLA